jgi:hypothetical protein
MRFLSQGFHVAFFITFPPRSLNAREQRIRLNTYVTLGAAAIFPSRHEKRYAEHRPAGRVLGYFGHVEQAKSSLIGLDTEVCAWMKVGGLYIRYVICRGDTALIG